MATRRTPITKKPAAKQQAPAPLPEIAQENLELQLSLDALFAGLRSHATLANGFRVEFEPAKMKHIKEIINFFEGIMERLDPKEMSELIERVSTQQRRQLEEGKSPFEMDMTAEDVVAGFMGNVGLIFKLLNMASDLLPFVVPLFTNMTTEEYDELNMEEGVLIPIGIFAVNYSFFTLRLLPVLQGSFRAIAVKKLEQAQGTSE